MADDRFGPKSAGKVLGTVALVGALACGVTLLVWGCTNNDGGGFQEPNRPFDAAAVDAPSGNTDAADAATAGGDAGKDGAVEKKDAASDRG